MIHNKNNTISGPLAIDNETISDLMTAYYV